MMDDKCQHLQYTNTQIGFIDGIKMHFFFINKLKNMDENGKNFSIHFVFFLFFLLTLGGKTVRQDKKLSPEQGLEPWTVRLKA